VNGFVVGGVRIKASHIVGQYINKGSRVLDMGENAPVKSCRRRSAAISAEKEKHCLSVNRYVSASDLCKFTTQIDTDQPLFLSNAVKDPAKTIYNVINLHTLENTLL
jgi:hypothetical protein